MRVVPRNDTETWIFREPTLDVFHNLLPAPSRQQNKPAAVFEGDFHMEFCDNVRQLLQASCFGVFACSMHPFSVYRLHFEHKILFSKFGKW